MAVHQKHKKACSTLHQCQRASFYKGVMHNASHENCAWWEQTRMRPQRAEKVKREKEWELCKSLQGKSHLRHRSRIRWLMSPQTRLKPLALSVSKAHRDEKYRSVVWFLLPCSYEVLFEWHYCLFLKSRTIILTSRFQTERMFEPKTCNMSEIASGRRSVSDS